MGALLPPSLGKRQAGTIPGGGEEHSPGAPPGPTTALRYRRDGTSPNQLLPTASCSQRAPHPLRSLARGSWGASPPFGGCRGEKELRHPLAPFHRSRLDGTPRVRAALPPPLARLPCAVPVSPAAAAPSPAHGGDPSVSVAGPPPASAVPRLGLGRGRFGGGTAPRARPPTTGNGRRGGGLGSAAPVLAELRHGPQRVPRLHHTGMGMMVQGHWGSCMGHKGAGMRLQPCRGPHLHDTRMETRSSPAQGSCLHRMWTRMWVRCCQWSPAGSHTEGHEGPALLRIPAWVTQEQRWGPALYGSQGDRSGGPAPLGVPS